MQQHLTHLALELLQERELRYEQRLQALEALVQPREAQEASPAPVLARGEQSGQEEGLPKVRRLHPAELRARSRVIPLIEYGAGVTDHLTIDCLEQMAAKLQSHLVSL